jgi:hypothetical protein
VTSLELAMLEKALQAWLRELRRHLRKLKESHDLFDEEEEEE